MATLFTAIFLAQEFHDISPPVNYSLVPMWAIFVAAFVALTVLGLLIWLVARGRKPTEPQKSPRERALEALGRIQVQIESLNPYRFSIRVSDILRSYVTEQYDLPVTRQTSVEFLERLRKASPFSDDEKELLEDFLNRCDLIKFARYEATTADSRMLLEEASRFVQGGALAIA
jgi:membrane protein implicated in regulation of membrane protease activity